MQECRAWGDASLFNDLCREVDFVESLLDIKINNICFVLVIKGSSLVIQWREHLETAQARPFDNCFPAKTKSLGEGCKALNGTACKKRIRRHSSPASTKKTTVYRKKAPANISASDEKIVKNSRAEFRKLRRFHFGREVPVFGICMCVILDCVLIALICIALQYEENEIEQQEAEAFASFESVHEALLRDAATQTSLEVVPTAKVEKTVTAVPSVNKEKSPEEIRAEKLSKKPTLRHQSDC
ncbi:unnamed protein product [Nippostrongylus brasiliensis]|uniref:TPX2 domain-containing protein n=1 Tax=Nippostrongylus brasiliensis TaxID=27835 RepID=A0A0N4XY93_NIPBR|nr:unnamed protein product [Nippostrongylus brasiliensis]